MKSFTVFAKLEFQNKFQITSYLCSIIGQSYWIGNLCFSEKNYTDYQSFFLFFSVLSSSFCRFTRAPHHENSLNLRWDWLELEQFFAGGNLCIFNLLAMNEKDPSRCFQQIGLMFLRFEFTNQPNVLNCDILYQDMTK